MTTISNVYEFCSPEDSLCTFPGRRSIAYTASNPGAVGRVHYRNFSDNVECNDSVFGDPSPGIKKSCYTTPIPNDVLRGGSSFYNAGGIPSYWTKCSDENGTCDPGVGKPVDILYGTNGLYTYANADRVTCNNEIFGDPAPGMRKSCYWRLPQTNGSQTNGSQTNTYASSSDDPSTLPHDPDSTPLVPPDRTPLVPPPMPPTPTESGCKFINILPWLFLNTVVLIIIFIIAYFLFRRA